MRGVEIANFRPIRLLRRMVASLLYLSVRFGMPIHVRLVGYKCTIVGKCVILAPPKQMQAILDGVKFLQTLDPEVFQGLTAKRRYVFWYHPTRFLQCQEIFTITDNFLLWGKEGVAIYFVQSLFEFTLIFQPFLEAPTWSRDRTVAARREVHQRIFKWASEHSFPNELVKQYEDMAKR
jgi:hypothetical protein